MLPRFGGASLGLRMSVYCNIQLIQKYLETYGMGMVSRKEVDNVISMEITFREGAWTWNG